MREYTEDVKSAISDWWHKHIGSSPSFAMSCIIVQLQAIREMKDSD